MALQLKIIGILLIVLSAIHVVFPRYFNWKEEFHQVSLINRQMMYIHTFFIAFVVLLMGLLCLTSSDELTGTSLGKKVALGLSVFWSFRLLFQFFGYSSRLWKGKWFETSVHVLFSILWVYLSVVFGVVYLY
ncbi:hypothetical protein V6R21_03120 [Limibacter armeniacum]|uniref:hypothetical protein n=1 Tax=Limibacter armeniacum TaxID=466084 RepID=UPI002FE6A511